ncbi:MAG: hypothetical protein IPH79_09060 [Sphingomonadales bacterium]|nr:hypothetical protein [Sphingomonadales bacterium]
MAYPCPGLDVACGQGIIEEQIPQLFGARAFVDQLQIPVKAGRHRHHFGQGGRRIDAVEKREREFRILPRVGGDALFAHPARFLTLDRGGHQPVGNHPPRDDEGGLPSQVEGIATRCAAQRIAARYAHPHTARCILDQPIVGEMRQKRRLPPRAPAIGAAFVAEVSGGGQFGVGIVVEGGGMVHGMRPFSKRHTA